MAEVSDIQIAVEAAGAQEAESDLDSVDQKLEETGDSAEQSAGKMGAMADKWTGAMGALVAGLAVAASGLLSKVPIIGQAFDSLLAVVNAVAFQMDSVLRPALQPLSKGLIELSSAIFGAKGDMGDLVGILGSVAAGAGLAVGALFALGVTLSGPILLAIGAVSAAIAALWTAWQTNFGNIRGITKKAVGFIQSRLEKFVAVVGPAVTQLLNKIMSLWNQWGDEIAAVTNFAMRTSVAIIKTSVDTILTALQVVMQLLSGDFKGAWESITNFFGRLTETWKPLISEVVGVIVGLLTGMVDKAIQWGQSLVDDFVTGVQNRISNAKTTVGNFVIGLRSQFLNLVNDATQWGKDLINELIQGIQDKTGELKNAVDGLTQKIKDRLPGSPAETGPLSDLDEAGPGMVDTFASGIQANVGQAAGASESLAESSDPTTSGAGVGQATRDISVFIDGRQAERGTRNYRDSSTLRRGRPK